MIDIRVYRASFVPAVLAVVAAMFSLQLQPAPLTSPLAPDAFDAKRAVRTLEQLEGQYPDRRPGTSGDAAVAGEVAGTLQRQGFAVTRQRFSEQVGPRKPEMSNVVGVLTGDSDRRIMVVAHRDSAAPGAATASAAATAVLLELASDLKRVAHRKTIVLVSTDGGSAGAAGARHLAAHLPEADKIDAAIVLDNLAPSRQQRPFLVPWGTSFRSSSLQLVRTAQVAVRNEVGLPAGTEGGVGQLIRLAVPVALQEQGPLVAAGVPAVTLTAAGELPSRRAEESSTGSGGPPPESLRSFGKAALGTVLALDRGGRVQAGPGTYLVVARQVLPGSVLRMLALAFLIPALVAGIDGVARARRRREKPGGWVVWVLAAAAPFLVVLLYAYVFNWLGLLPRVPPYPFDPQANRLDTGGLVALMALAVVLALAWLVVRHAVIRPRSAAGGDPDSIGAASAVVLLLGLEVLAVWIWNPLAAFLLVPAAHAWMLVSLPETPPRRGLVGTLLVVGLVLPALAVVYYAVRLHLGPGVLYYGLLLVTGGYVSFRSALMACLLAGTFVSALELVRARRKHPGEDVEITVRGPRSYAGPGSLGGTESAIR